MKGLLYRLSYKAVGWKCVLAHRIQNSHSRALMLPTPEGGWILGSTTAARKRVLHGLPER